MTKSLSLLFISLILIAGCSSDDNPAGPTPVPDPSALFSYSGNTVTPATITFNNTSQNADSYYWDFDDGGSSIQENPQHVYRDRGTYTVTLIAEAASTGKEDTYIRAITITSGKVFLDSITILAMPFSNQSGTGWDIGSGPDLIFSLEDTDGRVYKSWGPVLDIAPVDLPIRGYTNPPYEITNWDLTYWVNLYDEDLFFNDVIGWPDGFSINSVISEMGYPDNFTLEGWTGNSIRVRIAIHWE